MGNRVKKKSLVTFLLLVIIFEFAVYFKIESNKVKISYAYGTAKEVINIEPTITVAEDSALKIQALREKYNNNEIVGNLRIEGTSIDEPILKHTDNNYYLYHNAYGEYQAEGSVYEDYRTTLLDRKVLIFGHSSPGWTVPFNELERYYEKEFYDNHKYIEVTHEDGINIYEIFSVHIETADFTYMNINIDKDTYNNYLRKYQDRSFYKTTASVKDDDSILILQTCSNKADYQRYNKKFLLVVAKKIREVK